MPEEDIDAMRRCHVNLLEKINNVFDICQHLYQTKILNRDELDDIKCTRGRKEKVADILGMLLTRGNVLDVFIDILLNTRNEEAANILTKERISTVPENE